MLSILIPVYNYDIRLLVKTVHAQLIASGINFEINCLDDASTEDFRLKNKSVEAFKFVSYHSSKINLGRVATRQTLAENANFDRLLFLDADIMPSKNNFVEDYIHFIDSEYDALYGGFKYEPFPPKKDFILRWTYGRQQEQIPAGERNKSPYRVVISANMLIKKSVFIALNSQIMQKGYGYDNYFGALLKSSALKVLHLDNEVIHLGLEPNHIYLSKIEQAADTLLLLYKAEKLEHTENNLLNTFITLKKWDLNHLFASLFKIFKKPLRSHLISARPKILLLQFYKLGYICDTDLKI